MAKTLLRKNLPNLKELKIAHLCSDADLEALKNLPNLEKLELTVDGNTNLNTLNDLTNLKKLELYLCHDTDLEKLTLLEELPNLEKLTIKMPRSPQRLSEILKKDETKDTRNHTKRYEGVK